MKGNAAKAAAEFASSNELVVLHEPLVKRIAYHLMSRLPASVQADDLIQAGMIGLIEASRKFDPEQGASFETYAGIRIRGAMLDEIRRTDWTPRSVHRKAREVAEAVRKIENDKGRDARDVEVAGVMEISLEEYHKILQDSTGCRIFSFEDPGMLGEEGMPQSGRHIDQPLENLQKSDFKKGLADEIKGLPERERLVMALYYDEELNLREIGEILGVSESRVCQIHGQALIRLRARMGEWLSD
ncbi:MAG TPA: RNA polymerase sigma factor FliA [Gammaproteobacteria bacterium]|nr:RNA polymerase sigma factor FliA [Gammaproteobacteria bacterium]